jgi:hypothetical protein
MNKVLLPRSLRRARDAIDGRRAADDRGITTEGTLPQTVADDEYARRITNVLVLREAAPEQRLHSERRKELLRRANHAHALGSIAARERDVGLRVRGQRLEAAELSMIVDKVGFRCQPMRRLMTKRHDAIGVRIRKGPKQNPIDDAEDRGVCAHTEGDRRDDDDRKRRPPDQTANRVAKVLTQCSHDWISWKNCLRMFGGGGPHDIEDGAEPQCEDRFARLCCTGNPIAVKIRHRAPIPRAKLGGIQSQEKRVEAFSALRGHARAGATTRFASAIRISARSRNISAPRTRRPNGSSA